jgi:hypothetical protein
VFQWLNGLFCQPGKLEFSHPTILFSWMELATLIDSGSPGDRGYQSHAALVENPPCWLFPPFTRTIVASTNPGLL